MARPGLIFVVLLAATFGTVSTAEAGKSGPRVFFEQQFVYHSIKLQKDQLVRFTVTCPRGWTVADGGLERDAKTAFLSVSKRKANRTRSWEFVAVDESHAEQVVTVWIECIRPVGARFVKPKRRIVRATGIGVVVRQDIRRVPVYCPPEYKPIGIGERYVELMPGENRRPGVHAAASGDQPRIVSATPDRNGHVVTVVGGPVDTEVTIELVCHQDSLTTRSGQERRVSFDRSRVPVEAQPGTSSVSASCGDGRTPLGASSYAFGTGADALFTPSPRPDGRVQLEVTNETGGTLSGTFHVTCTRGRLVRSRVTGVTVDTTGGPLTITSGP